jgi:hypothetical protein
VKPRPPFQQSSRRRCAERRGININKKTEPMKMKRNQHSPASVPPYRPEARRKAVHRHALRAPAWQADGRRRRNSDNFNFLNINTMDEKETEKKKRRYMAPQIECVKVEQLQLLAGTTQAKANSIVLEDDEEDVTSTSSTGTGTGTSTNPFEVELP